MSIREIPTFYLPLLGHLAIGEDNCFCSSGYPKLMVNDCKVFLYGFLADAENNCYFLIALSLKQLIQNLFSLFVRLSILAPFHAYLFVLKTSEREILYA